MKKIVIFTYLLCCSNAFAGFEEGKAFLSVGNHQAAYANFLPLAENGNAKAQFYIGFFYQYGRGIKHDEAQAVKWYLKSAEQGDMEAQHYLGGCYEFGQGVEENRKTAAYWHQKAAEQGDPRSQYRLGKFFVFGEAGEVNHTKAAYWYGKAADQSNIEGMYYYAEMLVAGIGVPKDFKKAATYYQKVAELNAYDAQIKLGTLYLEGKGVVSNKVIAYALFDLSTLKEQHSKAATKRDELEKLLTQKELFAGKQLSDEMARPSDSKNIRMNNLQAALSKYLKVNIN